MVVLLDGSQLALICFISSIKSSINLSEFFKCDKRFEKYKNSNGFLQKLFFVSFFSL